MSIRHIQGAYLADTARVLGQVTLGLDVSIWYGVAIRGDVAPIAIGQGSNVQDNSVLHCDHGVPLTIGAGVTIGHGAIVHGIAVGDGSLIGMGARVLGGSRIGPNCLIAAGAVLPPNMVIPEHSVVMGVPGRIVRETSDREKEYLRFLAPHYVRLAQLHASSPEDPRIATWPGGSGAAPPPEVL